MRQISVSKIIEDALFREFKKLKGKIIYFYYSSFNKQVVSAFLIEDVEMRKGKAKARMKSYDKENKEFGKGYLSIIKNLKGDWEVCSIEELNKKIIIENLK